MNVPVYVLNGSPAVKIRPGSGIVGGPVLGSGRILVHYEGNIYGSSELQRYVQRVHIAWGRMIQKAATVAKAALPPEDLLQIGEYDPARMLIVVDPEQRPACKKWLGLDSVTANQLVNRNPLLVRDTEHFLNIIGTSGAVREFHAAMIGGSFTAIRCRWDAELKGVDFMETPLIAVQIESLIARGRLYLVFPSSSWGTGW